MLDVKDFESQYSLLNINQQITDTTSLAGMTLDEIECRTILQTLEHHKGNVSQVANALGISRAALYRRLEKYNITINEK